MKLTGRDKGIIIGVIVAIVWLVGILNFIKPNVQKIKENNTELENKTTELNTLQAQVEEEKNLPNEVEELKAEAVKIRSLFYSKKAVTEVDEIIKTKFDACNVKIDGMNINNEAALTLSPYMYTPTEVATDITDAAKIYDMTDESSNTSNSNTKVNQTSTIGYTVTVNYSAKKDDLNKFLADLTAENKEANDNKDAEDGEAKDAEAASLAVSNLTIADHTADNYQGTMTLTMYCVEELQTEEEAKAEADAKAAENSSADNSTAESKAE